MEYLPYYKPRERLRHKMRPGITGYAQVTGRNRLTWGERLELDVQYVERFSLWLDAQILWRTVWKVLAREDVVDVPSAAGQRRLDVERGARLRL